MVLFVFRPFDVQFRPSDWFVDCFILKSDDRFFFSDGLICF